MDYGAYSKDISQTLVFKMVAIFLHNFRFA